MNGLNERCPLRSIVSETVTAYTAVTAAYVAHRLGRYVATAATEATVDDIGKFKQIK